MTAEVVKLKKITPSIHTNHELVELFLDRLMPDFANRVASKLSMHRLMNEKAHEGDQDRNPEDMYDIERLTSLQNSVSYRNLNASNTATVGTVDNHQETE